jgi:hypothetical protein
VSMVLRNKLAAKCRRIYLLRFLSLLLLLGLSGSRAAARSGQDVQFAPVGPIGSGPLFAIADFDGDDRPDLASVEEERLNSFFTDYWIHLQLSASGTQSIQIIAPSGGLLIAAQDVNNGNHFIDLVLTTAWSRQPVAILINDGQGRFSRVEPKAFPEVFTNSTTNWASIPDQATGAGRVPPQPAPKVCLEFRNLSDIRRHTDSILLSHLDFLFSSFPIINSGRAPPPSEAPQF